MSAFGIIPACDVDLETFEALVKNTHDLTVISGYKIGFSLGLSSGLPRVVDIARKYTEKPLIYDHQKAGTDIPDTGTVFAKTLLNSGIDTAILFPQAGPKTQQAWIEALQESQIKVIVGGWMTHKGYTSKEGGPFDEENILNIYKLAAKMGVTDYVGPGNQSDVILKLKACLEFEKVEPIFYMPGMLTQGGSASDFLQILDKGYFIVGRAITRSSDFRSAVLSLI